VTSPGFAGGWRGSRALLRGPLGALVSGQALGQLGDGLAQISFAQLVLFDVGRGATPARIAGVLAATLLPFSIVGPFAGVLIDRWNRRRTLLGTSWFRVGLAGFGIAVATAHSIPLAYVGVLLLLSTSRFVLDAKGAVLPGTVEADQLVRANALSGLIGMTASFAGAVGGAMFVSESVQAGFIAAGVGYLGAGLCFRRLPDLPASPASALGGALHRLLRELWEGIRLTAADRRLRNPLLAVWVHRLLLGAGFIVLVLVADHHYHLSAPGYGLALAVTGVAAFAGTVVAPWVASRWRAEAVLPLTFLPPAAAAIWAGYHPTLTGLLCAVAVTAIAFQILKVLTDALVGRASPDRLRGRIFAVYDVLYNVAFVLAGLVMAPLWTAGTERRLAWWIGGLYALAWLGLRRLMLGRSVRRVRARLSWRLRLAALACGAIPVLSFPKPQLWWLAWVSLVPWLLVIRRAPDVRGAAACGWWGAFGFLIAMHYWLLPSTTVLLPVAAALLALLWMPWAGVCWLVLTRSRSAFVLLAAVTVPPAMWVLVESVRAWSALGGPWGLLGASQWRSPVFLAPAALGGVWLVSYLIVACNVAIVLAATSTGLARRASAALVAFVAVLAGPACWALAGRPTNSPTLPIAVIEAGVIHDPAARLAHEIALTEALPTGRYGLVVWGESSVGVDLASHPDVLRQLVAVAADKQTDLLVNVDAAAPDGAIRKTSVLIDAAGVVGTYSKIRLVPFGEYIPMRQALGWLSSVSKAAATNRVRGTHIVVLPAAGTMISPLICFESAFPDMTRTAARLGARLVVFQTATTTFQGTWAPDQHASLAAVRAAESGRPTVQAALSGTSAAFDAWGRQVAWYPAASGTMPTAVPTATRQTVYDRYGDWLPAWCFVIVAAGLLWAGLAAARLSAPRGSRADATLVTS
jgi:apolipoprotein N-acyltransferase